MREISKNSGVKAVRKAVDRALTSDLASMLAPRAVNGYKAAKEISRMTIKANAFAKALTKPFDTSSMGARVPDNYCFPTAAYHLHEEFVIAPLNTGQGQFCVAAFPNPVVSLVDFRGAAQGAPFLSIGTIGYPQVNSLETVPASYGMTDLSALTVLSNYRVVSAGLRIRNLQPELSATGRIIVVQIPIGDEMPSIVDWARGASGTPAQCANFYRLLLGVSAADLDSSAVLDLPGAKEYGSSDFLHGDLQICHQVVSPAYYNFRGLQNTVAAGALAWSLGDTGTVSSTGTLGQISFKDPSRMVGGCAIVIFGYGFPVNISGAPLFSVEQIMHMEGTPRVQAGKHLVPSNAPLAHVGSTLDVESGMAALNANPMKYLTKGTDFLN